MALNIGINVIETDGKTAPALAGAPTSVAGLVLRSRRGPVSGSVRISKFSDFVTRFGGHFPGSPAAYCVEGFFLNGGQEAHIARVTGAGAAVASVTLKDRAGNDTLLLQAGYRGETETGAWGNDLYIDIRDNPVFSTRLAATRTGNQPARLQGQAIAAQLDLSVASGPARRLRLDIDNPATQLLVTFDAGALPVLSAASRDDIANAINKQAGGRVAASVNNNGILIVSRTKGATSRVVTAAGVDDPTRDLLGFPTGNTQADGAAAPAGPYTQVRVQSFAGFSANQWLRLSDGITSTFVQVTGLTQQDDGSGNMLLFVNFAAPAASDQNEYRIEDKSTLATVEFDLIVKSQGAADPLPVVVETWEKLTMDAASPNYAPSRLSNAFSGSAYVTSTDTNPGTFSGADNPRVIQNVRLGIPTPATSTWTRAVGNDGSPPSTTTYLTAFSRFNTESVQLISVLDDMPDGSLTAVTRAGVDYCGNRGDCMFVGHTPAKRDMDGAKAFGQDFRSAKAYGALYWPWIMVSDPIGAGTNPVRVVPPTGHVLGVYARTDQTRGVWKAPAGNEASVRGALSIERALTDADHTDLVKNGSVNGIRQLPGVGIVIDSSRTLSTDNRWQYVNVRLLFNFVKASLRDGLRWVKQEPNRETLWSKIKFNAVTPFLLRLYQEGAFGPGKPNEVFTVIVGPENNPPQEIALGNLKIEVYFFPSRPAETILIIVGQQDSGATASEA